MNGLFTEKLIDKKIIELKNLGLLKVKKNTTVKTSMENSSWKILSKSLEKKKNLEYLREEKKDYYRV